MADIYRMPGHLIRRLHQISTSVFLDGVRAAGHDITAVQFAALTMAARHPGIDQARLAGLIAYDRATIGGVLDRLEARGFVAREVSPTDRRARVVKITRAGRAVLEEVTPAVAALQDEILPGLTAEERETFIRLAEKASAAGNRRSRAPLLPADPLPSD
ncbi:MarR family winged helix-turn-helix transcriptional regulator [Ovoidimarina sediminis]|uniref:MarR family winged helix-turn-helix transcriptional regulator n=1 Tax=Ovoidimarina sediminis TaxID=3079856 RepID=UPI002909FECB|nr:MarR family transcriptional regulator [Rhodophyticola sp. MJ-SS7]MDU8943120.1 MarR family transcriptional regulator [Rhodophyticola sp. MJ-SS7]